jgi:glycerophosphoryl diester phosphodiesterase
MSAGALRHRSGARALVVAHRGAWDPAPQNSLAAFEAAIAAGADAIELDVRRTGDGHLVVVHDPRLGLRPLSTLCAGQIRERMAPGQAPELAEVLAALAGRIGVDLELKEDGHVAETMALVADALPAGGYVVTSFIDAVLPQVRAAVPQARTGLLLASRRRLRRLDERLRDTGADFIAPHAGLLRGGLLEWASARRLATWPWTINDDRAWRALLFDPRVEAVITDHAARAVGRAAAGPDLPAVA